MRFRLTTTVEYKGDDLKALRSLAKEFECTPKEWLEIHVLREGEESARLIISDEVDNLFEEEEGDEYFGRYVRD